MQLPSVSILGFMKFHRFTKAINNDTAKLNDATKENKTIATACMDVIWTHSQTLIEIKFVDFFFFFDR